MLKLFMLCSGQNVFSSRWFEESLRNLEILSEQQYVLLNDLLGFSKLIGYLLIKTSDSLCRGLNSVLKHERHKLGLRCTHRRHPLIGETFSRLTNY